MQSPEEHIQRKDAVLSYIIDAGELPTFYNTYDVFSDLISCMLDQQIPCRSRGVYMRKLKEIIGSETIHPEVLRELSIDEFIDKKIARPKHGRLVNLADYWLQNDLASTRWYNLPDDKVRKLLTAIPGVGDWTIDMILLFTLERPDIFNPNDYQLKKIMSSLYNLEEGKGLETEIEAIAQNWKPYRSQAVLYLLKWAKKLK